MSRLRWPESTNSVSEKPGTIQERYTLPNLEPLEDDVNPRHAIPWI